MSSLLHTLFTLWHDTAAAPPDHQVQPATASASGTLGATPALTAAAAPPSPPSPPGPPSAPGGDSGPGQSGAGQGGDGSQNYSSAPPNSSPNPNAAPPGTPPPNYSPNTDMAPPGTPPVTSDPGASHDPGMSTPDQAQFATGDTPPNPDGPEAYEPEEPAAPPSDPPHPSPGPSGYQEPPIQSSGFPNPLFDDSPDNPDIHAPHSQWYNPGEANVSNDAHSPDPNTWHAGSDPNANPYPDPGPSNDAHAGHGPEWSPDQAGPANDAHSPNPADWPPADYSKSDGIEHDPNGQALITLPVGFGFGEILGHPVIATIVGEGVTNAGEIGAEAIGEHMGEGGDYQTPYGVDGKPWENMTPYPGYGPEDPHPPMVEPPSPGPWHTPQPAPPYSPVPGPDPNHTPVPEPEPNYSGEPPQPAPPYVEPPGPQMSVPPTPEPMMSTEVQTFPSSSFEGPTSPGGGGGGFSPAPQPVWGPNPQQNVVPEPARVHAHLTPEAATPPDLAKTVTSAPAMHSEAVQPQPMHTQAADTQATQPHAVQPQGWTHAFTNSTVLNPDGTSSTHYPDGTQDVRAPDGSCWRLAPSGGVVHAWQEPPAPQWRPPESVAAGQPDGGTVVYHPDGSKELWHGGTPVMRFDPTGRPAG